MGIFDFFKKKDKNTITSSSSSDKGDSHESVNDDKKSVLPASDNASKSQAFKEAAVIEILQNDTGSHGDNFGGLLGFNYLSTEIGKQFINEMMAASVIQAPTFDQEGISTSEVGFSEVGGNDEVKIKTLSVNDELLSAFPYFKTKYTLPFETKEVIEWSHVNHLEAEIKGGGRDTFGLAFFATDYAENKAKYRSIKKLSIHISAIALVLDKSDLTEINGTPVSSDFATYMPNNDLTRPTYYDFIGVLNAFKPCNISRENSGYILNVKLINQEEDPDFFTVDLFVNRENMRIDKLTKGMKVAGALWFQGEIA